MDGWLTKEEETPYTHALVATVYRVASRGVKHTQRQSVRAVQAGRQIDIQRLARDVCVNQKQAIVVVLLISMKEIKTTRLPASEPFSIQRRVSHQLFLFDKKKKKRNNVCCVYFLSSNFSSHAMKFAVRSSSSPPTIKKRTNVNGLC